MKKLALLLLMMVTVVIVPLHLASAANCKSVYGIPTWYRYVPHDVDCGIDNTRVDKGTIAPLIILGFIDIALYLAGILAVFMIIWGGYKFILGNGSPEQIAGGRKTILNAVIGLVIVIFAAQIVRFIASKLSS